MATVEELLTATQAVLGTESEWCKGAGARKVSGLPCAPLNPDAVSWDIWGALVKASVDIGASLETRNLVYKYLRDNIPSDYKNRDIESYNDAIEFADLAGLFS